jgi:hypothetical protein
MKARSDPSPPRKRGERFASDLKASPTTIVRLASSFYLSQTKVEQGHIADALVFKLSRVALNPPKTFAGRKVGAPVTHQKIGGGPSVLYDAVVILPSKDGANILLTNASAKDFVSDAFGHLKFIAFVKNALRLFKKTGLPEELDWQREQVVTT